jgi:hypothetical protein
MAVVWYFRKPETKIEYQEKIVEKEVTKRNVVVRTIRLPDGTVKTETIDKSEIVKDKDSSVVNKTETKQSSSKYAVSVKKIIPIESPLAKDFEVSAGLRAVGPVWVEAGYGTNKTVTLGVRMEF